MDSDKYNLSDFLYSHEDLFNKCKTFSLAVSDAEQKGMESYMGNIIDAEPGRVKVIDKRKGIVKETIVFCKADYLGLSLKPNLKNLVIDTVERYGVSSSSVSLIAGTTLSHKQLEMELADFKLCQSAMLFPTGYAANMGVISTLCGKDDAIIIDKQVHCSILEGAKLAGSKIVSFRHSDINHLEEKLVQTRRKIKNGGILVVVEGVYGIDGDVSDIKALKYVCRKYGARLMVDEAHATGVMGKTGRGTTEGIEKDDQPDIIMDSLSKAIGSFGGWIGGDREMINYLRYYSKPAIFSVSLPPINVCTALAGLQYLKEDPALVLDLQEKYKYFKNQLVYRGLENASRSDSAIISFAVNNDVQSRKIISTLYDKGVWAEGLEFPAVPKGQARIRMRISAAHTYHDLDYTISAIDEVIKEYPNIVEANDYKVIQLKNRMEDTKSQMTKDHVSIIQVKNREEISNVCYFINNNILAEECGVPWITLDVLQQLLTPVNAYLKQNVEVKCWALKLNNDLCATCTVMIDRNYIAQFKRNVGFLGYLSVKKGYEENLTLLVEKAIEDLQQKGIDTVIGPANYPMFIFGSGLLKGQLPYTFPFYLPYYSQTYEHVLRDAGFNDFLHHKHFHIDLMHDYGNRCSTHNEVRVRNINKLEWESESKLILNILNQTFPRLGHYVQLSFEDWSSLTDGLRPLVISDFWKIAEVKGEAIGFVCGFPNCDEAYKNISGEFGTVDILLFDEAYKKATSGHITWLGVVPGYEKYTVGEMLLHAICKEMKEKKYQYTDVMYELVDGEQTPKELVNSVGGKEADYSTILMSKTSI